MGAEVLEKLVQKDPRYPASAYVFVLMGLRRVLDQLPEPHHITGQELSLGCRELALELYGAMARTVLAHWGILTTRDIGEVVFNMLDAGILSKTDSDSREDFEAVFDFVDAFERNYPWGSGLVRQPLT